MIALLSIPLALIILVLEGTLALRLLEGKTPVLMKLERMAYGLLLAGAGSAFIIFWCLLLGVPMNVWGFGSIHVIILIALLLMYRRRFSIFPAWPAGRHFPFSNEFSMAKSQWNIENWKFNGNWEMIIGHWRSLALAVLIVWTLLKITAGAYSLLTTPSYHNDTYANWNMRTKIFYENESLMLHLPENHEEYFGGRVPSYPLTVYFTKLWFVLAHGEWSEPVVNIVHFFWFISLLIIFYCALLRELDANAAIIGTAILVSVPLLLLHGSNAYTDVLMAAHVFSVLYFFFRWLKTREKSQIPSTQIPSKSQIPNSQLNDEDIVCLRLFSVMTAAMVFVKNEALLIFLPPVGLLFVWALWRERRPIGMSLQVLGRWIVPVITVALPWVVFKIMHGLAFGNAQGLSEITLTPNSEVRRAIEGDLLYTGNYPLLFPLFLLFVCMTISFWRKHPLKTILAFVGIVFVGECMMYYLVPFLGTEAINHTGFGRGMIHIVPLMVFAGTLMLRHLLVQTKSSIQTPC